jgi:hypothetical protein
MAALARHVGRWEGKALALYGRLIRSTAQFRVEGLEHLESAVGQPVPTILSFWHGQNHLLLGYLPRVIDTSRVVMIVPDDHRRVVLETLVQSIDASPFAVSMSDESMAGARRLLLLIRGLRQRGLACIAPDGPDGPSRVPKPGIAFIAEQAGAQVLPIGAAAWPCLRQARWDRYMLPLPYARVAIAFRPSIGPPARTERDAWTRQLSHELTAAAEEASAFLHRA